MDDDQSSFFGRFYNCANSIVGKEVSNPCKPGQKSFVAGLFDSKPKEPPERAKVIGPEKRVEPDQSKEDDDEPPRVEESVIEKESYRDNKIDSPPERLCFIKEQNPLDPCCCELKTDDDEGPCPPAGYSQNPRAPGCGCELCRKSGYHGSCCGRRAYVQGGDRDPPRFEQA